MTHINFGGKEKQAVPRGYVKGIALEIEWITNCVYVGDGLFIAHLISPHAETDFYYQFNPAWAVPDARVLTMQELFWDAYYWNPVYLDFRPLPTGILLRANVDVQGYEFWITEPDYALAPPIRCAFPLMPSTYWRNY